MKGTFFGVSVGPGDPELMTRKAVRVMEHCPVLAVPETAGGKTLALDIAQQAADLEDKEIVRLRFTMSHDPAVRAACHEGLAQTLRNLLDAGRDVAMLNLGDVSIYSTFWHLAHILMAEGYPVEIVPGVPSFCAVAAELKTSLTQDMHAPLHILPARGDLDAQLALPGSKVLMKAGTSLPAVKEALRRAGQYENAQLVSDCGLPGQRVAHNLDEIGLEAGYFATIVVKEEKK